MPRPKRPEGYPKDFLPILKTVMNTKVPFTWRLPSNKAAQLKRFQLYDYFKACRNSNEESYEQLAKRAASIILSIKGNDLVIAHRDEAEELKDLAAQFEAYRQNPKVKEQEGRQEEVNFETKVDENDLYGGDQLDYLPKAKKVKSTEDILAEMMGKKPTTGKRQEESGNE